MKFIYDKIGLEKFIPEITDFCKDTWVDYGVKESPLLKELLLEVIALIQSNAAKKISLQDLEKYKEGIRETRENAIKCITDHIKKNNKVHLWWD